MESSVGRCGGWLAAGFATLGLGCQTLPGPVHEVGAYRSPYPNPSRVAQGALVGSLAGAAIGAGVDHHDRGRGALIGAVGGLLAGALFGGGVERYEEDLAWRHHHHDVCRDAYGHLHPCDEVHSWDDAYDEYGYDDYGAGDRYGDPHDHAWDDERDAPPLYAAQRIASDVLFDPDSAALSRGAKSQLRRLAERVRDDPGVALLLRGHADGAEAGADRFELSEQRARAVRAYLTREGVPNRRIAWVGFGAVQPVASNQTPEGRQRNRRVEVVLREPV